VFTWGSLDAGDPSCEGFFCFGGRPHRVVGLFDIATLDAGNSFNLAISGDGNGRVLAWGHNQDGQLGDGSTEPSASPVRVFGLRNVVATATGNSDALALLSDGTVMAWGNNQAGQLGNGQRGSETDSTIPHLVHGLGGVTAIAAGGNHAYALLENGTVMAWGSGESGQLGNGSTQASLVPSPVTGLSHVRAISSGNRFGDALLEDGTVMTWGYNRFGQLGDGSTTSRLTPVPVVGLSNVKQISGGGNLSSDGHNIALLNNGTVMTWGDNESGQLGDGTTTDSSVPVAVHGLSDVSSVAAGGAHSMALLEDGTVMTWGSNEFGQLGNGTTENSVLPTAVLDNCTRIAAGSMHSLAACNLRQ
jgi:alpha-tubulin suppressor-like RCC1 family protein